MSKSNKIASGYNHVEINTDAVFHFFNVCGDAKDINEALWDMFASSISNPDDCVDAKLCAERSYFYKRLTEFISSVEPQKPAHKFDRNNNN
jgi:hypothetical protein